MKEIKVRSTEEGVEAGLDVLAGAFTKQVGSLAFTGGNFGNAFLESFIKQEVHLKGVSFFQTDERYVNLQSSYSIQKNIKEYFLNSVIYQNSSFNFFNTSHGIKDCLQEMNLVLESKNLKKFDFVLLSLAEDGHLAGHFPNSIYHSDKKFCYTLNSSKPPKERISFSVPWLFEAKVVVLAAIGENKKIALREFLRGNSLHSEFSRNKNLYILRS